MHLRAETLVVLALGALAHGCGPSPDEPRSNADGTPAAVRRVILISCDTLRADRLDAYGYERGTSPELAAFAREGILFEEAYASAPMTQPSLSSLLTGKLPEHVGVAHGNLRRLPAAAETLPERLREHGIPSAAVISNWVLRRGAAEEGDVGVQQGFEHYDDEMTSQELNRQQYERLAPDTTRGAIAWLDERDPDETFFLWVHYQDPHGPYTPPRGLAAKFSQQPPAGPQVKRGKDVFGLGQIPSYQQLGRERRAGFYSDLYDAEIRYFDREFGKLIAYLREHEFLDDALVIFTSDHGESLGEHDFWFCHGENVHREQVRIPFILRFPPGTGPDVAPDPDGQRRVQRIAGHLDLWPTVLDALGLDPGTTLGSSLLRKLPPTDRVLGQALVPRGSRTRWWAVGDGQWRVVWNDDQAPQLFDVRADPAEEVDLAAEHPERVTRMMETWRASVAAAATDATGAGADMTSAGDVEALKFLGYVDDEDHEESEEE